MTLGEGLTPWGLVIILNQPITYLLEVHSLYFMEFGDDIEEFLLIGSVIR